MLENHAQARSKKRCCQAFRAPKWHRGEGLPFPLQLATINLARFYHRNLWPDCASGIAARGHSTGSNFIYTEPFTARFLGFFEQAPQALALLFTGRFRPA